jgi:Holliday junction resolvase
MSEKTFGKKKRTRSQIGKASKNKGKVGEREIVHLLREFGYAANRGQQFKGSPDSPDVISPDFHDIHIEVKRTESLSVYEALRQAKEDASIDQRPLVFHRRSGKEWIAIIEAKELLKLLDHLMLSVI